ncbi:ABC transporter permease, partial [Candidatus Pacearchaeota archaeon]|nr:ABC transporter permease [Candidatus Pacearchaeota archaeon]
EFIHEQIELEVETGRALKDGDGKKVFLGYNFYVDKVGLDKPVKPGNKVLIQDESFEVVGIGKRKGSFIFDNIVYMNDRALNDLMDYGDNVDIIAVQVKDKDLMEKAKEDIEKLLRKRRDVDKGEEDFEISTPEAALETVNQVLTGVQIFVALVAFISIFVGAIGIVNTMTTSVLERRKEIGVMKAIGARNEQIFALFFIESGLMGLIGGILGVGIGLLIGMGGTNAINNLLGATASMTFNIPLIVSTLVGSFLVGSIAGIAPAMQAARQHPVDALRG